MCSEPLNITTPHQGRARPGKRARQTHPGGVCLVAMENGEWPPPLGNQMEHTISHDLAFCIC